ncbi:hypothetical protein NPIL_593081 [Nephila pilipes]|uniref:Uncharacterized protein n=1 Tax=Nephila pilipes TaxID=299642 RepID=A0A8X6MRP8_NEPPI|nr:hypothetical protein NPIL_593081 [Nephila pilipes]
MGKNSAGRGVTIKENLFEEFRRLSKRSVSSVLRVDGNIPPPSKTTHRKYTFRVERRGRQDILIYWSIDCRAYCQVCFRCSRSDIKHMALLYFFIRAFEKSEDSYFLN